VSGTPPPLAPAGRAFWEDVAGAYGSESGYFERAGMLTVAAAGLRAGERVADIACGTGACLLPAARGVGPAGTVVGVDQSETMAARARQALAAAGAGNARVATGDAGALPLAAGSFDAVLCGLGVGFFTDLRRAVAEIARVLRDGGRFAWSVAAGGGSEWAFLRRAYARFGLLRMMTQARAAQDTGSMPAALDQAGLTPAAQERHVVQVRFAGFDAWWEWLMASGMREFINRLDQSQQSLFRALVRAGASGITDDSGLVLRQNFIVRSAVKNARWSP